MQETSLSNAFDREHFDWLSKEEQSIVMAYANHLNKDTDPLLIKDLIIKVNEIHLKHPEFHMGCVPFTKNQGDMPSI